MNKSPVDIQKDKLSVMEVLSGVAGLTWEVLALVCPRLRQTQVTLARSVNLDGAWESAPRRKSFPLKRRWQFVRVEALDDRQKYGHHPEGVALGLIRVEGVTTHGEVVSLKWSRGVNTWSDFSLPIEARETRLVTIRIKSDLGIPVRVRWMCDEIFIK